MELHLQLLLPTEEGGRVGNVVVADFPYTIGRRRECSLRVSNPCVSRDHCRIFTRDGRVWVEDLGSLNGTYVNEERVGDARPLQDGDVLRVAYVVFKVRVVGAVDDRTLVEPAADGARAERPRRVLVVEDDANAAESLALVLKQWGCQVRVAHDGSEAVRSARDDPPDAVLLDLCLPGMDGYQVARRLRQEVGLETAQMVAMTGRPEEVTRNPEDTGVERLLLKPVGADALREVIGGA